MKCPKCGFTSFDELQDCKKCGSDLAAFKSKFNLRSLLRPFAPASPTTEKTASAADPSAADAVDFGYDFMEEEATEPVSSLDDLLEPEAPQQAPAGFDFESNLLQKQTPEEISEFSEFDLSEEVAEDKAPLSLESDFSWDDFADESSGPKDKSSEKRGFDIPSLEDLPSLDDLGEDGEELPDFPDLPDFDFLDEEPSKSKGKPRDPFDVRRGAKNRRPSATFNRSADSARHAPVAQRLRAAIVDTAILCLAFALFLAAGEIILTGGYFPSAATLSALFVPYALIFFLLCFGYFTLFHSLAGQTVGKMLFGLRVEAIDGNPILFSQAFLRAAGGVLCLIPLGLGFLHILRAAEGRGLNDRLGGTLVVMVQEEEAGEEIGEQEYAGA